METIEVDALQAHLPLGTGVRVLAANEDGLVALHKPQGLLSHPNDKEKASSLLSARYDKDRRCYHDLPESAPWREVFLLNRLDSATSGVLLLGLNAEIAQAVREAFTRETVKKRYLAIVKGRPKLVPPVWQDHLIKRRAQGQLRAEPGKGARVTTRHRWLQNDANGLGGSLIELQPVSGKTHQLRVQCQMHGVPILGDKTYGDFKWNQWVKGQGVRLRLFLHSQSVTVEYQWAGQKRHFTAEAPLPDSFKALIEKNTELRRKASRQESPNARFQRDRIKQQANVYGFQIKKKRASRSRPGAGRPTPRQQTPDASQSEPSSPPNEAPQTPSDT